MNPLFNLKQSAAELPSLNDGLASITYDQHPPTRDVTGDNFPNGAIHLRWQNSGGRWWIPSKSYIRIRAKLFQQDGTTVITSADNIAPNMGFCSNLFQSCEFRIADKTVSRVSDYMAQVDALRTRLTKSKSYLDTVGSTLNFWQHSYCERQAIVASDGGFAHEASASGGITDTNYGMVGVSSVQIIAAGGGKTGTAVFILAIGSSTIDVRQILKIGDVIESAVGVKHTITGFNTSLIARVVSEGTIVNAAAAQDFLIHPQTAKDYKAQRNGFECIWQPPLSIFNVTHAMPSGKYEILLNPQTASVYMKNAIESLGLDRNQGAGNDFQLEIVDMYLYLATVEGPVVENVNYFLSLEETRCQTDNIDNNNGLQQKNFDISPASFALTVAFQDTEAGVDTRRSASKFKIRPIAGTVLLPDLPSKYPSAEMALRRLYVQYAGQTKPSPDADPDYVEGIDYVSSRYAETMLYSGAYFDCGGAEDKNDWILRGPYYYFSWPKDGSSESTRCLVNYSFTDAVGSGVGRVLLFDHYKQMVLVSVTNGMVTNVVSRDA